MTAQTKSTGQETTRAGTLTLVLGALFLAATAFTYVLSLDAVYDVLLGDVDPPNWVRALGLVWLPIGFLGTPIAYGYAHTGTGRDRARVGLLLMLVGLVAFVALNFAVG